MIFCSDKKEQKNTYCSSSDFVNSSIRIEVFTVWKTFWFACDFLKLVSCISGDQTALIQTVPINQLIKKGDTAKFDCVYQHSNVIEWYFKDIGPLETNNRWGSYCTIKVIFMELCRSFIRSFYGCVKTIYLHDQRYSRYKFAMFKAYNALY